MDDHSQGTWRNGATLVGQGLPLAGMAAIATFNATQFSPIFDSISYYLDTFARGTPFYHPDLSFNLTSVFISLMTLLIAGIPAALYERIRGLKASTPASLTIWLVAAALLSLPTIMRLLASDDLGSGEWAS